MFFARVGEQYHRPGRILLSSFEADSFNAHRQIEAVRGRFRLTREDAG